MSSKRWLVAATAAVTTCAAIAGCTTSTELLPQGGPTVSSSPSAATGSPSPTGPVTLRFGVYGDDAALATYNRLARSYTRGHPRVTVKVVSAPDARTAMRAIAGGRVPDVFLADHDAVPALVHDGTVQPVNELLGQRGLQFGDSYQRSGLEAFSADSALQCMPQDVSPLVVYYNKDLLHFRKLVAPGEPMLTPTDGWTWDQFVTAARQMSHGGVKGVYIEPSLDSLIPLVRSAGADVMDDDRKPTTLTMSDGDARSALEQVLRLVRDPRVTPTRGELAEQDALNRFETGRIGMIFGTRALTPRLREAEGLHFDVFPLPKLTRYRTLSAMTGYCISAHTANTQAAADFLAYAVGSQGAAITAASGAIVPSNLQVEHSAAFIQPGQQPEHATVFSDAVHRSDYTPSVLGWSAVEAAARPEIERLFYAPVLDLDSSLPRLDQRSRLILQPPSEPPSPSASASGSPSASPSPQ